MKLRPAILCALGTVTAASLAGCPPAPVESHVPLPEVPDAGPDFRDAMGPPSEFAPQFGNPVTRLEAPPPISGGTMAITADDIVVASDPDRDEISVADVSAANLADGPLAARVIRGRINLAPHSEPGRAAIGPTGRAYVALRNAGTLVTIDTDNARIVEERAVCPAPRGVAFDGQRVLVACVDGDLLTLPPEGGSASVLYHDVVGDLRDVVVRGSSIFVTRFRTSGVLVLDASDAHVVREFGPRQVTAASGRLAGAMFQPAVAWRAVAAPNGAIGLVHQRALLTAPDNGSVDTSENSGGYGSVPRSEHECGGSIVHTAVSFMTADSVTPAETGEIPMAVLPVDMAISADGSNVVVVAAGNAMSPAAPRLLRLTSGLQNVMRPGGDCEFAETIPTTGQPTAVVFRSDGTLVVQSREPAMLTVERVGDIVLDTSSRFDTGHAVFHANSGGGLACAGCHPEGGDDARVWVFSREGMRRTQNLRGGLLGTEPFHWGGDQSDFGHLANDVFVGRMSGSPLEAPQVTALARWIDRIPTLPAVHVTDTTAVDRGRALFASSETGCTNCHAGAKFSNNSTTNVGTGGALQVPTLIGLRFRAPFMHTGCAATLRDRFTHPECGGGDSHGHTSQLSSTQVDDLVAYLQTL